MGDRSGRYPQFSFARGGSVSDLKGLGQVGSNVFATFIGQKGDRSEAQAHNFRIKRVEFAKGGNVDGKPEDRKISLEGASAGNPATDSAGKAAIATFDVVNPAADRSE